MQISPQITIKDIPHSAALQARIIQKINKLNSHFPRIMTCRVVVEIPQKHQHQGKLFNVRIDITLPGEEFPITKNVNEDVYVAIRDAFGDADRRLEEFTNKIHGEGRANHVKIPLRGTVDRIFSNLGYGFIEALDGHDVYFHHSVVKPAFKHLTVGTPVHFLEEMGEKGPQASRVKLIQEID